MSTLLTLTSLKLSHSMVASENFSIKSSLIFLVATPSPSSSLMTANVQTLAPFCLRLIPLILLLRPVIILYRLRHHFFQTLTINSNVLSSISGSMLTFPPVTRCENGNPALRRRPAKAETSCTSLSHSLAGLSVRGVA